MFPLHGRGAESVWVGTNNNMRLISVSDSAGDETSGDTKNKSPD